LGSLRKVDFFAVSISFLIHGLLLSLPAFKEILSNKTYTIVDAIPITFDPDATSSFVGTKPSKGRGENPQRKKEVASTAGKSSAWEAGRPSPVQAKASRSGEVKKRVKRGRVGRSGSRSLKRLTVGRGNATLSLSVDLSGKKRGRELPSIAYNRLVPYLIKVRDKIMKNWVPPYYKAFEGKRRVVVALKINEDGSIDEINIIKFSPDTAFNRSAVEAIYASEPFGKFPKGVNLKKVSVKVNFEVR